MDIKDRQRRHYDRLYLEYEDKSRKSAYMNLLRSEYALGRWVDRLTGKRVLDLGCGPGETARQLTVARCFVVGLDLSMQFVCRAREQVERDDMAAWIQGDAERLPLANETLDGVVSLGTLHHLPQPELAIREISRLLKPGGWLLAMEANATRYHNTLDFYSALIPTSLRGKLTKWRSGRLSRSKAEDDEFHVGARTPDHYRTLLKRTGMSASVTTLILPLFPFTLFGLHRHTATWRVAICLSQLVMALVPSLRGQGQVQIIESKKLTVVDELNDG